MRPENESLLAPVHLSGTFAKTCLHRWLDTLREASTHFDGTLPLTAGTDAFELNRRTHASAMPADHEP